MALPPAGGWAERPPDPAPPLPHQTSCLQYLDARNTPLLDHSAPFVARALRIRSSLAVLHLENASLSGRPLMLLGEPRRAQGGGGGCPPGPWAGRSRALPPPATALKMNMNLRELYLADNKLNGLQDSAQLGNLLKFNCSLQILDLRNNHVLDSGVCEACLPLRRSPGTHAPLWVLRAAGDTVGTQTTPALLSWGSRCHGGCSRPRAGPGCGPRGCPRRAAGQGTVLAEGPLSGDVG